jgi:hypothetical protein
MRAEIQELDSPHKVNGSILTIHVNLGLESQISEWELAFINIDDFSFLLPKHFHHSMKQSFVSLKLKKMDWLDNMDSDDKDYF